MKWQTNPGFVEWLLASEYAEMRDGKVYPYLSGGCVLYCYEAWCAAQVQARSEFNAAMAEVSRSP
jgi:hypothetical protein